MLAKHSMAATTREIQDACKKLCMRAHGKADPVRETFLLSNPVDPFNRKTRWRVPMGTSSFWLNQERRDILFFQGSRAPISWSWHNKQWQLSDLDSTILHEQIDNLLLLAELAK